MFKCKISENLVQLRLAKGVTQNEVARNLSVSDKTVSKWENGGSQT
ncbi:MAG: XRE family transcriptional regulator [Clostridiales bacterium]|nr:MAG: XRE family transcriptional regulator [Clostridiales bacterium]